MNGKNRFRRIISLAVLLLAITAPMPVVLAATSSNGQPTETLGIDVRILDTHGEPVDQASSVTIWKQVDEIRDERASTTTDPRDGTIWQRVSGSRAGQRSPACNGTDRYLAEKLGPGTYCVTAFVGSRNEQMLGMARNQPITLDGSQATTAVSISIEDGPPVTLTVRDSQTREPITYPRPGIDLIRQDGFRVQWNPLNGNLFPGDDGKYRIQHLAPGTYRLDISARSHSYGYPDYDLDQPLEISVLADQSNDLIIEVPPKPIDDAESQKRWPWAVSGTVTDPEGEPLAGVQIRAACGWGTLFSTMPVTTGVDGRYLLRFSGGMRGVGVQASSIFAYKDGWAEANLGRQGDLMMAGEMPEDDSKWDRDRIVLPGDPFHLDFRMVRAAKVDGLLLDEQGEPMPEKRIYLDGDLLPPSSSVAAVATTDGLGRFQFDRVAPEFQWWFEPRDTEQLDLPRTQAIQLKSGRAYEMTLQVTTSAGDERMLRIASLKDSHGADMLAAAICDDVRARALVTKDVADNARKLLERMSEVNRYWFRGPAENIESFSYEFHLAGHEPRTITDKDYATAKSWYREWYPKGISYTGAARVLTSLRDRAKFREVQVTEDQISMYFDIGGSTVAAGNGIGQAWSGFFNAKMNEGRLVLDAKRMVPLSIQYGRRREVYSDYLEIEPGHFAPRRIQILSDGMNFDFRFRVLQPNLWLFDRSFGPGTSGDDDPVAWLTDVTINGKPAVVGQWASGGR